MEVDAQVAAEVLEATVTLVQAIEAVLVVVAAVGEKVDSQEVRPRSEIW
ncbi:MAG: hypothetical protein ABIC95_02590 [archaeon]